MFQTFDVLTSPDSGPPHLAALRGQMKKLGLAGFIVPRADEYQNEYIPAASDRLRWLTGFTGSAGTCVVTMKKAALVTDGRYLQQAANQIAPTSFEVVHSLDTSLEAWVEAHLPKGGTLGLDPWLHTADQIRRLAEAAKRAGGKLKKCTKNPLDAVWKDRPPVGSKKIVPHPLELAGEESSHKLVRVAAELEKSGATHLMLTQTDSIAWLFNIRGGDVDHSPLPLAFAIVGRKGKAKLFLNPAKLEAATRKSLSAVAEIMETEQLASVLSTLAAVKRNRILIDPATSAGALADLVIAAGGNLVTAPDPLILMKAPKNPAELAGTRAAHRRDGAAIVRFLHWFEREAPKGKLDEIAVATALEGFRAATGELLDIAFPSIAGAGPNGSIIHYRPTHATNRKLDRNSLFLIDSGGQYRDGTTDITRTLAVGEPTLEMRQRFTCVLKGMIAISRARFPKGTTGTHLDALARQFLWREGLDFDHGTGHGVGVYLSVHEGPQRIAKTPSPPLEPGMIISDEPGYYKPGAYGIRLENLLVVTPPEVPTGGERPMMGFETLTLAPFDRRCLDSCMLNIAERAWLDAYHAHVFTEISPLVEPEVRAWLKAACARL